jgi:hypothetical protein
MRVLMGVDGSSGSFAAVQFAGRLLEAGSHDICLYCSPPHVYFRAMQDARGGVGDLQQNLATAVVETLVPAGRGL